MEIDWEVATISGIVWLIIMAMFVFLPKMVGTTPWKLWQVLIIGACLLPISYFIIQKNME